MVDGQYKLQAGAKVKLPDAGAGQGAAAVRVPQPSKPKLNEHLRAIHPPADRHFAADGGRGAHGWLGYFLLPISALPPVDFPTIQVTAQYPGASPDVMASSVTTPLERQFGQISGLAR